MFASVEDLATYLQVDEFSAKQSATAEQNLEIATQTIKDFLGQDVEEVTSDTITLDGSGSCLLELPQAPVTAVTSVTLNGILLVEGTQYAWYRYGILDRLHGSWGTKWQSVDVVYSHGYAAADIPDSIKGVCLALASRMMGHPDPSVTSKSIGTFSESYGEDASGQLSEDEMKLLIPYSRMLLA